MVPILVTGGSGQVGTALKRLAAERGLDVEAPDRAALDLADPAAIERVVASRPWSGILNCAAYTAVDKAESEPELASAINAAASGAIARAAAARGIRLLHVSTDYVFDGSKPDPYREEDPVAPLGAYGGSKEAGERAVRDAAPDHLILRTAWVVSPWGHNFVKTMLRLGRERGHLRVVADQQGCPTSAIDIADTLLALLGRPEARGTYHFVNDGAASWYELARFVLDRAGIPATVDPIATTDYPTPAKRPANSRLDTGKIRALGVVPRPWQDAVGEVVDELMRSAA